MYWSVVENGICRLYVTVEWYRTYLVVVWWWQWDHVLQGWREKAV